MTESLRLRIVRALPFTGNTDWKYDGICDLYHTLYFIVEGDGHIRTEKEEIPLRAGNAVLIPRELRHDLWCESHIRKTYVDFYSEYYPGCDPLGEIREVRCLPVGRETCLKIYEAAGEDTVRARTFLRGCLLAAAAEFLPERAPELSSEIRPFLPIVEEIRDHPSASLRREEIATRYGWNPSSFSRAFHRAFGCGFKQYLERLLTERIGEELLVSDKTLQAIAEQYGFCDAYYLSAFFKRQTGISPAQYRRRHAR